jgi:hypothetical protein
VATAISKTNDLFRPKHVPMHMFVKNPNNPNKMKPREFDLLCDNFEKTGWTDPVLCRPSNRAAMAKIIKLYPKDEVGALQAADAAGIKFHIVGGHHRYDAGAFLGFESGPATVIMSEDFDEEQEKFQIVRMNVIHGKMDPQSFFTMYSSLAGKYADDVLQDAFGFAEEAEFKRMITVMAKTLPDKTSQDKFKEAAAEVKTIDGLSKLLNEMFNKYGDTLPYGYMIVDMGGQKSYWLRVDGKTLKALDVIADICVERNRTMDDLVGRVVQLIAQNDSPEFLEALIAETPQAVIPKGLAVAPTKDNIQKQAELAA